MVYVFSASLEEKRLSLTRRRNQMQGEPVRHKHKPLGQRPANWGVMVRFPSPQDAYEVASVAVLSVCRACVPT